MKFWQFVSVCRDLNLSLNTINLDHKWKKYMDWYTNYDSIVENQDRSILDSIVPDELCRFVFSKSDIYLYFSGGYLRKRSISDSDQKVTIINAYKKYGGEKLEEAFEAGLVKVA